MLIKYYNRTFRRESITYLIHIYIQGSQIIRILHIYMYIFNNVLVDVDKYLNYK